MIDVGAPGRRRQLSTLALLLSAFAPAAAGTLVVANKTDNTVDLLDSATGVSAATLPTGRGPHEVAVSPDGGLAVISNYGPRDAAGASLTVIDVREAAVLRTIELGRHTRPHGLAWVARDELVVTTEGSASLLVVDPLAGRVVREIETAQRISHMVAVARDSRRAFVANIESGSVTVLDLAEGRKIRDIETGAGAEGLAITPDGKEVWVANREADTLSVIDTATLEVRASAPCPGFPIRVAIAPDGSRALASCARAGEVAVFDVVARKELLRRKLDLAAVPDAAKRLFGDRFGTSPAPVGLVIAPDGSRAWVAATQADAVVAIDPRELRVLDVHRAGHEPDGMAYTAVAVKRGDTGP